MIKLGKSIPENSDHAISVSLPTWNSVIGYEEKDPEICNSLKTGYPRFVIHKYVKQLCEKYNCAFIFSSYKICLEACNFALIPESEILKINNNLYGILNKNLNNQEIQQLKYYWQHTGNIISSRQALYFLENNSQNNIKNNIKIFEQNIKTKISELTNQSPENIYLFPNGMNAIFEAFKLADKFKPESSCLQFGFPYIDTLKLQQKFYTNSIFCLNETELKKIPENQEINSVFCEFPSNPLLESPNLENLNNFALNKNCLLIIDETIGSFVNINLFNSADIIISSLTKFFSGVGDVMGGCLILNSKSKHYFKLKTILNNYFNNTCWAEDLEILDKNSEDFKQRILIINKNAEILADYLKNQNQIETVYYPKYQENNNYKNVLNINGGFGGLLSFVLKDKSKTAKLYDILDFYKGPSLGTNYTLICPYVFLAHYDELNWAESCGVSRFIIRVSVGLENINQSIQKWENALNLIK